MKCYCYATYDYLPHKNTMIWGIPGPSGQGAIENEATFVQHIHAGHLQLEPYNVITDASKGPSSMHEPVAIDGVFEMGTGARKIARERRTLS